MPTSPQGPRGGRRGRWTRFATAGAPLCASVCLALSVAPAPARSGGSQTSKADDPSESGAPLDLRGAQLSQSGDRLDFEVSMAPGWGPRNLAPRPSARRSYLCLKLRQKHTRTLCLAPRRHRKGLILARPVRGGRAFRRIRNTSVNRLGPGDVAASIRFTTMGIAPGALDWRVASKWARPPCKPVVAGAPGACYDLLPDQRWLQLKLKDPIPVGCRVKGAGVISHGSRKRKLVGLSFDDGPGTETPDILRILRRFNVRATFFQVGVQLSGHSRKLEHQILEEGNELGNHTQHHTTYPDSGEIAEAQRTIRRYSGFSPCLFRPPGGGVNGSVVAAANANDLKTIIWDVDPRDWANPGTGAIVSNVLANTQRGSIILMHDGASGRSETVAALPQILLGLRHRHLKPVTVTHLLGGRVIFR
jgi:peptidoglycan-N-acetylglucosamine deacetylase